MSGIDYGLGRTNIDRNGIRYGVINMHSIAPDMLDALEADYGEPTCPTCGELADDYDEDHHDSYEILSGKWAEYACLKCQCAFDTSEALPEQPLRLYYVDDNYAIESCLDSDLIITKSPFYTLAAFCSPCVPGAGSLDSPTPDGIRTYCLGPEWFEPAQAPYPIYVVTPQPMCEECGQEMPHDAHVRLIQLGDMYREWCPQCVDNLL